MALDHLVLTSVCIVGFLSLTKLTLKFLQWVWCMFLRPPRNLKKYGSWAMITGCTDGMGKALAFELASKGLNLVLVGRNIQKLQDTSNEIWEKVSKDTQIKHIVIEFASIIGEEIELKIKQEIDGLDIGVLVNNVGVAHKAKFFHEVDLEECIQSIINVNIGSVTWVTRAVLPGMLKKKKGAIVNIGSGSTVAVPSYPLATTYASTKAYLALFSRTLSVEYQKCGIDIQCQMPMTVATKMVSIKKPSLFVPSPKQFSKASIRWIGYDFFCVPYWIHALQCYFLRAMPDSLTNWLIFQHHLSLRKKVLKKESMNSSVKQEN